MENSIGAVGAIVVVIIAVVIFIWSVLWFMVPFHISTIVKLMKSMDKRLASLEKQSPNQPKTFNSNPIICPICSAQTPKHTFEELADGQYRCSACFEVFA